MATYSTAQAARKVKIGRDTLHRWMRAKRFPVPEERTIGGVRIRLWTEADLQRVREYKKNFYGKGKGPKKASNKSGNR